MAQALHVCVCVCTQREFVVVHHIEGAVFITLREQMDSSLVCVTPNRRCKPVSLDTSLTLHGQTPCLLEARINLMHQTRADKKKEFSK